MGDLNPKPLEINDWSGGITDNFVQGDPRRSQTIQNYFITVDKKLEERRPFVPFSPTAYQLGSNSNRVNGMFTFINESILMAATGRTMYYLPPGIAQSWAPIAGIGGSEVIQAGDQNSQITYGEFQRHIYLTSDGTAGIPGAVPSKIYRNTSNVWTAVTAGLPRSYGTPNYTTPSLLATCINLANQIRTSFINHFNDAANPTFVSPTITTSNLHSNIDKYSLAYLVPQVFVAADPQGQSPGTGVAACTDQPSLFTLVYALCQAYTNHISDALAGTTNYTNPTQALNYHIPVVIYGADTGYTQTPPKGPHVPLTSTAIPTTLVQAAAQLDDLYQKWNWHRKAVWTHSIYNDPGVFDKYGLSLGKIGTVYLTTPQPTITPDFTDLFNYVNNIQALYNSHLNYTHTTNSDYSWLYDVQMRLPDCNDLDSMYLKIFWLRVMYQLHQQDAAINVRTFIDFSATNGSANITAVKDANTGASILLPINSIVFLAPDNLSPPVQFNSTGNQSNQVAVVTGSGFGTATLDRIYTGTTQAGIIAYNSFSIYHVGFANTNGLGIFQPDYTTGAATATSFLANPVYTVGTDTASWLLLAQDLYVAYQNHMLDTKVHVPALNLTLGTLYSLQPTINKETYSLLTATTGRNFFIPAITTNAYAFFFTHNYTVEPNGVQYLVAGNPVISASQYCATSYPQGYLIPSTVTTWYGASNIPTTRANVITNLPTLVNTPGTNYDTANVMLNIYKTTNAGQTFYLVAQVPNGTTTYSETTNDSLQVNGQTILPAGQQMYTTGGNVGSDQPPQCKYMHILNGTAYYGAITDSGQFFPNRVRQSVQLAPDWCPASFNDDLDDAITGISSTRSNAVVFCQNSIYRMLGGFAQTGQGSLTHERISDTTGAWNAKSIVRTEIGIFFAGTDGFYYTDAYQIIKISLDLDKTYASLVATPGQQRAIWGTYDKTTRRIWWSMRANANDTENSVVYVFYLNYGVKPSGVFTTITGQSLQSASLVFQNGNCYLGHGLGFIMRADTWSKADYLPVVGATASTWQTAAIPYNWTSCSIDMGTTFMRKWITKMHVISSNIGNQAVQAYAIRDLNETGSGKQPFSPILYSDNVRWGQLCAPWGQAGLTWKTDGKMDVWRWFPQKVLHSDFMQVSITPSTQVCYSSSVGFPVGANAVVNNTTKTAVIQTPTGYTSILWPEDVVGYSIQFQYNGYATSYLVTALSGDQKTITFSDAGNTSLNAPSGTGWQLYGTRKAQRSGLTAVDIHYAYLGQNNTAFGGTTSAGNVGSLGGNPS